MESLSSSPLPRARVRDRRRRVHRLLAREAAALPRLRRAHATVRNPCDPKNAFLKKLDRSTENLRLIKADMLDYDTLTAAFAGCEGAFHVATPVPDGKLVDPEKEMMAPAVEGTRNVLKTCSAMNVKKLIQVSSVGAVIRNADWPQDKIKDESCWSDKEFCRENEANTYIITRRKGQGGMGFRDLHLFNQALLARQAWRLIAFPDSLCARLLKAKYYPDGELTDTAFIQNPSPGWQGIMHGLELLKKGIIWRIGNGKKVRIWRDNWVPRGDMKITANANKSRPRKVAQLINQDNHTWKEDVVRSIFMPFDADEVLKIRLPNYEEEDFVSWTPERHGLFTVRSAYKLALDLKNTNPQNSSANTNSDRGLWKLIWNADVPPKVRIFTWRLATNSLAVQVNRSHRLQNVLPTCSICGMEEETGYHATMRCTKALALRQGLEKIWNLPSDRNLAYTGEDWVLVLLEGLSKEMRSKMMFIWWRAWHHRNNVIFDKGDASIDNSISFLQNYLITLQRIGNGQTSVDRKGKAPAEQSDEQLIQKTVE